MDSVQDRIVKRAKELGLRQVDIAKATGASKGAVSNWFSGNGDPRRYIIELSKALKTSPDFILEGAPGDYSLSPLRGPSLDKVEETSAEYLGHVDAWDSNTELDEDEVEVPYYMDVELAAGTGSDAATENPGFKLRFSKSTLRRCNVDAANAACVKVSGNSMEPRLFDGDVVGVNTADKSVVDGKTYAINHDGMLRVKRLYRLPSGGLRVNSINSAEHPDESYTAVERQSIQIIGKVFWHSSIWD